MFAFILLGSPSKTKNEVPLYPIEWTRMDDENVREREREKESAG